MDEGIALSFGKDPDVVTWERLKSFTEISPFAAEYARRRRLIERAVNQRQLTSPLVHAFFVSWLKQIGLSCPPELETEVLTYGTKMQEWSKAFEEYRKTRSNRAADSQAHGQPKADVQRAEIKLSAMSQKPTSSAVQTEPKPLRTRERETALKLIIGMAVGGYSHDPTARRSATVSEIAEDLHKLGLSVDPDTIRKWLKEATEILPRETE